MISPLRTAFVALAFAGVAGGIAEAKTQPTQIVPADVVIAAIAADSPAGINQPTVFVSDDAALTERPLSAILPAAVTTRLAELSSAGNMPSATADLTMWGGSAATAPRSAVAKRSDPFSRFARGIINRTSTIALTLTRDAFRYIGTPYVFGGTTSAGFDCSGYVQHVFAMLGISLPRTADAQYYAGRPARGGMRLGDLVFFQTYAPGPSHVGIYLGGGKFISSSGHGVMISSLGQSYWASRFIGAKRVVAFR